MPRRRRTRPTRARPTRPRRTLARLAALVGGALAALVLAACGVRLADVSVPDVPLPDAVDRVLRGDGPPGDGTASTTDAPAGPAEPPGPPAGRSTGAAGPAAAALEELPVKGRAPKSGYAREQFGQRWKDVDRNGCDTRNDVLRRDLSDVVVKPGTHGCRVLSGLLHDPYTGTDVPFTAGAGTSAAVQIDHVVALSDAWQKGAQALSPARREALANDPLNLLAVDGPANRSKSDADAATWLPPRRAARCPLVARQIAVKAEYGLWVTPAEHDAMARVLDRCPGQGLPARG